VIVRQASVQRCNATVDFLDDAQPFFPPTINNPSLHVHFQKVASDTLGPANVIEKAPLMGSEDFAFFSDAVPATYYYFVGVKDESKDVTVWAHSPFYTINEAGLPYGAALQASLALDYLSEFGNNLSNKGTVDVARDEL
jgi:metal-dependent amidase/aminoacylase/carboxypeptidase family protein